MDLARAPRRAARKKGSGYENGSSYTADDQITGACEGVLESEPLYYDENPSDVSSLY
jgi:hypothetical protein